MESIADAIIRTPEFGLTVEQRKRARLFCALSINPTPLGSRTSIVFFCSSAVVAPFTSATLATHVLRSYLKSHGAGSAPCTETGTGPISEDSAEFADAKETIIRLKRERQAAGATLTINGLVLEKEYAFPFKLQMMFACKRKFLSFWRSSDYIITRIFSHVAIALSKYLS
ncbi:hypothetical protein BFJ67_g16826 [Fusarium oxysporum f. sp. cepae]|nr:hypothetical protein BFJ67_g16826 [Fusarium oxysporum f. sp. cepae]